MTKKYTSWLGSFEHDTSAQALNQILAAVSQSNDNSARFVDLVADHLELHGEDAKTNAISILYNLVRKVKSDIERLPHDESVKQHARSQIKPFNGLESFSHVHLDLKNSKANFLKPDNLVGLLNLHMALSGHVDLIEIDNETKSLADKFHDIQAEIISEDLPEHVKRVLLKRSGQITSILNHFYAFGAEALQEEIEALVGAIVLNAPQKANSGKKTLKKLCVLSVAVLVFLKSVDAGLGTTLSIADKGAKLIEMAQQLSEGDKGAE